MSSKESGLPDDKGGILRLVLKPEEACTKYGLVKATGLRTPAVTQQLERLHELGWILRHGSSLASYQINTKNEVVRLIHHHFLEIKHVKA